MKKNLFLLIFSTGALTFFAQNSFYKNALVVEANAGVEIYKTTYQYKTKNVSLPESRTETDGAGNSNFSLGAEYGLHKRFGVGARFKTNSFFTEQDTVTKTTPKANSFDISALANFHAVSKKHFDLVLGTEFGYSKLTYKQNDASNLILTGKGTFFSLYVNPRIYFGDFGINFKVYAPFINYPSMTTNNETLNTYVISKWKGTGFGLSFGIQYRFLDSKD